MWTTQLEIRLWLEWIKHFDWSDSTQTQEVKENIRNLYMVFYQSLSLSIKAGYLCCFRSFCGCFFITRLEVFFSPDHNQAPISSYCSGWKAISCTPADVLWDMNDLIKSHAKGQEMSARACGRWKLALVPSRQEMRRSVCVNDSKHPLASGLDSVFHVLVFLEQCFPTFHPWSPPPYI